MKRKKIMLLNFIQQCLAGIYRLSFSLKRTAAKNYFVPVWIKKAKKSEEKITIIHQRNHWTQYLEGLFNPNSRFISRRSSYSSKGFEKTPVFKFYDPETLSIVIGGFGCFWDTWLTRWHRVLVRLQHSPGWGMETFVWGYDWTRSNGFKLMIPQYAWDRILKTDSFNEDILRKRDQIIKDGTPLAFTHFDPKLNRIFNHARTAERQPGTVLISCNWRVAAKKEDTDRLLEIIRYLSKDLKIALLLHPNTLEPPQEVEQTPSMFLEALQKTKGITETFTQDSVDGLVKLYDQFEYIVTDGSGTVYEAIARGCKALTLDGLSYQKNRDQFHAAFELGLLPKTLVKNYKNHFGEHKEMEWLKSLYPASLVKEDVTPFVAREILDVFDGWQNNMKAL